MMKGPLESGDTVDGVGTMFSSRGWHAGRIPHIMRSAANDQPSMTTIENNDAPSVGRPGNSHSRSAGFQWTCPFCGKSRTNKSTEESGQENATAALRAHIIASDGADHGPTNEYPTDAERLALSEYVVRMDSR